MFVHMTRFLLISYFDKEVEFDMRGGYLYIFSYQEAELKSIFCIELNKAFKRYIHFDY